MVSASLIYSFNQTVNYTECPTFHNILPSFFVCILDENSRIFSTTDFTSYVIFNQSSDVKSVFGNKFLVFM